MNAILITGAAGYLGGHIIETIVKDQPDRKIIAIDNLSNHNFSILSWLKNHHNVFFLEADFADVPKLENVLIKHNVSEVIHLAAKKYPTESFGQKDLYWNNNVSKLEILLDSLTKFEVKNLVFSSSASVYGDPIYIPIDENHKIKPQSPYAVTKSKGEELCKLWQKNNERSKCIILRYFNPMGYSPNFKHQQPLETGNMTIQDVLVASIIKRNNIISIYGTNHNTADGTAIRDFVHIKDLSNAHLAALVKIKAIKNTETINIGTGKGTSLLNLIKRFSERKNVEIQYVDKGRRTDEISISYASVGKAQETINWSSEFSLNDIIDAIQPD
ncbi:UDP-glucose 4-epimerase GalE [Amylibacter sp.]|nr:UDP-glucose 4-epimerase GalE [Amylibacter sp.]